MLRFIIERRQQEQHSGLESRDYYTIDIDAPELEQALTQGGYGEMGFDHHRLKGVEILSPIAAPKADTECDPADICAGCKCEYAVSPNAGNQRGA